MKFGDDEIEELASKIRKMKEEGTHLCCSIGFLTKKQALMLKEAGLDRINHNSVSYTHLDVYKRQIIFCTKSCHIIRKHLGIHRHAFSSDHT